MDNVELRQAVSELVMIASNGIAEAIQALPAEVDDSTAEAALHACMGHIEMIVMAAEMAELPDLQQHCLDIHASLHALPGDAASYLKTHGQCVLDWSQAIVAYVEHPGAAVLPASLPLLAEKSETIQLEEGDSPAVVTLPAPEMPHSESRDTDTLPTTTLVAPDSTVDEPPIECPEGVFADTEPVSQAAESLLATREEDTSEDPMPDTGVFLAPEDNAWTVGSTAPIDAAPDEAGSFATELEVADFTNAMQELEPESTVELASEAIEDGETAELSLELLDTLSGDITNNIPANHREDIYASDAASEVAPAISNAPEDISDSDLRLEEIPHISSIAEGIYDESLGPEVALDMGHIPEDAYDGAPEPDAAPDMCTVESAEDVADEAGEDDFFAMLQQLTATLMELEPWRDVLTAAATTEADAMAAAHAYSDLVQRIQVASAALDLAGLDTVCTHVNLNVALLAAQTPVERAAARQVLEQWVTLVLAYLNDPSNDTQGLAIVIQLQQEVWPLPLDAQQAEELCKALCPDSTEDLVVAERPSVAQPEDVLLSLAEDVNPRLLEVFLRELPANAADFSACITRIGQGEEVFANLRVSQRLAHNMKGSANLVGVKGVANLTHHIEDILEYLSEHHVEPPAPLVQTLQEAADCVETMLEALQGMTIAPPEAQRILQDVFDWANRMDADQLHTAAYTAPVAIVPAAPLLPLVAEQSVEQEAPPTPVPATAEPPTATSTPGKALRIPVTTVDRLYRMVGEMSIALDQLQDRFTTLQRQSNDLRLQNRLLQQRRFEMESFIDIRHVSMTQRQLRHIGSNKAGFDPLELNEYDELYSTSRSFIEAVTDSTRMQQQLRSDVSSAERMLGQIQRLKRDLETTVRGTRMEEVSTISARLQRSVRQACRATGKQVELAIEGAEVLLDSEMLDKLADPLMHILRNAVDHGIESSEQRLQRGKPAAGTIRLRFFQEGNTVVVQCRDDGQGLDYQRIHETALTKGLLTRGDAIAPQALARLTLTPGFSTRATATQLSGRGVGLDVVYTAIKELKGVMEIGDAPSGGCQIVLRLPLTLLTSHCLVVSVAGQPYAVPTSAVARALPPRTGQFSAMGTEMAFEIGQEIYPARSLAQHLNLASSDTAVFGSEHAILLAYSDTGVVALTVDQLLNNYHLVVKSLGPYIKTVRGVSGLATLADGRLLPVLDVAELLRTTNRPGVLTGQQPAALATAAPRAVARVLIVDDSMSVRQSLAELLEDAGYQSLVAHDGVEAVDILRTQTPDLVLTDLEMPRMNGLELVSYIRTNHSRELPVVVVTSRTTQKHRQQAMEAGVNLYVTKPYAEETLLSNIQSLLN